MKYTVLLAILMLAFNSKAQDTIRYSHGRDGIVFIVDSNPDIFVSLYDARPQSRTELADSLYSLYLRNVSPGPYTIQVTDCKVQGVIEINKSKDNILLNFYCKRFIYRNGSVVIVSE